jgi:hypothetical protein
MPARPLLVLGAGGDEILAMVRQKPDVERALIPVGFPQRLESLAQRRPGDAERVDRVGLAALAGCAASAGHCLDATTITCSYRRYGRAARSPATLRGVTVVHVLEEGCDAGHREDTLHGVASVHK